MQSCWAPALLDTISALWVGHRWPLVFSLRHPLVVVGCLTKPAGPVRRRGTQSPACTTNALLESLGVALASQLVHQPHQALPSNIGGYA